jgi:hypothetical protein
LCFSKLTVGFLTRSFLLVAGIYFAFNLVRFHLPEKAEGKMKNLFAICFLIAGLSGTAFAQRHAYWVTVTIDGLGSGSINGTIPDPTTGHIANFLYCEFQAPGTHLGTCRIERLENEVLTFTPHPAANHSFAGWRAGSAVAANPD